MTSDNLDNIYCWTDDGPCEGLNFQFATNYPSLSDDHEKNIMTLSYESSNETGYYPGDVKEKAMDEFNDDDKSCLVGIGIPKYQQNCYSQSTTIQTTISNPKF